MWPGSKTRISNVSLRTLNKNKTKGQLQVARRRINQPTEGKRAADWAEDSKMCGRLSTSSFSLLAWEPAHQLRASLGEAFALSYYYPFLHIIKHICGSGLFQSLWPACQNVYETISLIINGNVEKHD